MNRISLFLASLLLGLAISAGAQATAQPNKVAVINVQGAIAGTQEGQKALTELQNRYEPRRKELEKMQNEIASIRDQLGRGSNTLSEEAKNALTRDIDQKTKAYNRANEDAQADYQLDLDRIMSDVGQRLMAVIDKYARDNGYSVILDIGSQQTPVVYASNTADITNDIIALYDKNAPVAASGAAPKPAAPSKPAAAPAKK